MIQLPPREPRKIVESDIVRDVLVSVNRIAGVRAGRNNVGTITDSRGIPVSFGLGVGSPDIVGIISIGGVQSAFGGERLHECMPLAFAFGLEVKQPGKYATRDQRAWHATFARRGVFSSVVRCGEEAERVVIGWVNETRRRLLFLAAGLR